MDGLRPVGSEAIKDPDKKLARILEMAGIKKSTPTTKINENSIRTKKNDETVLHTATASNGTVYGIVQEGKHVYVKEAKNGYFEYIGGVQNIREHSHKSYADALKHLNFMFKEINALTETKNGTSILSEGYKLKVGAKEPAPEPSVDSNPANDNFDFGSDDNGGDTPDFGADDNGGDTPDFGGEEPQDQGGEPSGNGEEETPVKKIQKLAGKLAQEIRDAQEGDIDDKLAKSVTNTVLSATLGLLSDEGKNEIANKLEDDEDGIEADGQDFDGFDAGEEGEDQNTEEPAGDDTEGLKLESGVVPTLEEDGLPEHDEPYDPSPMSKPGDHEVHGGETEEVDPYSLFETALNAIMQKAGGMQDLKELKNFMAETWGKMEGAYNNGKYMAMGKLAEAMDDVDEHNEPNDPSPMSKPGNHEVSLEEHNEPNDPSPMSKPGNHEVKAEKAMENPEAAIKGGEGIPGMIKNPAKAHLHESEDKTCPDCGKEVCECGKMVGEEKNLNESYDYHADMFFAKLRQNPDSPLAQSLFAKYPKLKAVLLGNQPEPSNEPAQVDEPELTDISEGDTDWDAFKFFSALRDHQDSPLAQKLFVKYPGLQNALMSPQNDEYTGDVNEALNYLKGKINEIRNRLND